MCVVVVGWEGCVGGGADGERKDVGVFGVERGVVVLCKVYVEKWDGSDGVVVYV